MNPITTQSRYGDKRTIECVNPKQGIFKIYGKSHFARQGKDMFDFEGGPMLMVGEEFYGFGTIAGLDSNRKPEDHNLDACVYVSVDMNKKTIKEFTKDSTLSIQNILNICREDEQNQLTEMIEGQSIANRYKSALEKLAQEEADKNNKGNIK